VDDLRIRDRSKCQNLRSRSTASRNAQPLKHGARGPLNSYVHSGIHPIVPQHAGVSDDFALATLLNANGLTGMAAMLAAELSGDPAASAEHS